MTLWGAAAFADQPGQSATAVGLERLAQTESAFALATGHVRLGAHLGEGESGCSAPGPDVRTPSPCAESIG